MKHGVYCITILCEHTSCKKILYNNQFFTYSDLSNAGTPTSRLYECIVSSGSIYVNDDFQCCKVFRMTSDFFTRG